MREEFPPMVCTRALFPFPGTVCKPPPSVHPNSHAGWQQCHGQADDHGAGGVGNQIGMSIDASCFGKAHVPYCKHTSIAKSIGIWVIFTIFWMCWKWIHLLSCLIATGYSDQPCNHDKSSQPQWFRTPCRTPPGQDNGGPESEINRGSTRDGDGLLAPKTLETSQELYPMTVKLIFADPMAFDLTVMILVGGDEVDICADDDESMSVMICIPKKPYMNIHPWGIGWGVGELIWWHVYPWGLSNAGSHAGQRPTTRRTGCSFCIVSTSGVWVVRLLPPAPSPSPRTSPLHPPFSTLSPSFWVPKCLNQLHFLSLHPHTPQSTSLRLYSGLYAFFLPDDLFHIYLSDNSLTLSGLLPAPFFLWARHPLQVAFSVQSSWICGAHNMQKS